MLLAKEDIIRINETYSNIIGHMGYAAYKLWNVCNYEKINYSSLGLIEYPDWYYQKKAHKDSIWYKSLPSQTAQEVCKLLEEGWKSFFSLIKNKSGANPHFPKYRHDKMPITYMQNGIMHKNGSDTVRLTLSRGLKEYMQSAYGIKENYLYLKSRTFQDFDNIKQIQIYPPKDHQIRIITVYEIPDVPLLPDNGRYLSVDIGIHNLMTCYDSRGKSFILGRQYLSICRRYDKVISHIQAQWYQCQASKGIAHPKGSAHITHLYERKRHSRKDYLHKVTHWLAMYCHQQGIHTVVIGDITGIRKNKDFGAKTNQKMHALPFRKIVSMLQYKLALYGINVILQEESWTSQCPPSSHEVSKKYAKAGNRRHRGLYIEGNTIYNADSVGAYNILRKYIQKAEQNIVLPIKGLSNPEVIKVAV